MSSSIYFERYAYPERFIKEPIKKGTFLTVVIPAFKEDNIIPTLEALINCEHTVYPVEVIWVINHPENASNSIKDLSSKTVKEIEKFVTENPSNLSFHIIKAVDLPYKKAGVGLARKIGMDEAAFRLNSIDQDGIILCFDADSSCKPNYLEEVEKHFLKYPNCTGASIHYEHPLLLNNSELNSAIVLYELHLRYYIQALKYCGYPYSFHTIGSSMAVRSSIYQKQGGMNQRKAGEDFYFLHKIIPLGHYHNISSTKVIPSARISNRVPFGTGRAMQEHETKSKDLNKSYDFQIFKLIKIFLENIKLEGTENDIPIEIFKFLKESGLLTELEKVKSQAKDARHFKARFFEWFNGFKMLKMVHFLRDRYYPDKELNAQAIHLLPEKLVQKGAEIDNIDLLDFYRKMDSRL